jgi:hypothetical protein
MSNIVSKEELQKLSHKDQVRFALFCANQIKNKWESNSACIKAINTVKLWLDNKATAEECRAATRNAHAVAAVSTNAAAFAAYATVSANYADTVAYAAADTAAYAAADATDMRRQQREYYNDLRYVNENFEKIILESI